MTSVNMPRDDAALRIDPKAPQARNVNPAEPYPAVQPVSPKEEGVQAPPPQARQPQQRRHGERRQKDETVLLDTRSGRDRRKSAQRNDNAEAEEKAMPAKHIDVYT